MLSLVPAQLYVGFSGKAENSFQCHFHTLLGRDLTQVSVRFGTVTLGPNSCFKLHCCVAIRTAGFHLAWPASRGLSCSSAATLQLALQVPIPPGLPCLDRASALMRPWRCDGLTAFHDTITHYTLHITHYTFHITHSTFHIPHHTSHYITFHITHHITHLITHRITHNITHHITHHITQHITQHSTAQHSTLHYSTLQCITVHYSTFHCTHYTLHITHYTFHIPHSTSHHTSHSTSQHIYIYIYIYIYILHFTFYILHFTFLLFTFYILFFTFYILHLWKKRTVLEPPSGPQVTPPRSVTGKTRLLVTILTRRTIKIRS